VREDLDLGLFHAMGALVRVAESGSFTAAGQSSGADGLRRCHDWSRDSKHGCRRRFYNEPPGAWR